MPFGKSIDIFLIAINFKESQMEENTTPEPTSENQEEEELSHSDKIIGILTEPTTTFEKISKHPPKTIDWLLPITLLLVVVAITRFIVLSNPEIYYAEKQKQVEKIQERFDKMVQNGQMTKEQADEQMNKVQDNIDKARSPLGYVLQFVGILVFGFVVFFIVSAVYFLFSKFILKGDGTYAGVMVANGLTAYIAIISVIIAAILSMIFSRLLNDVSIASLVNANKMSFSGFLLSKLDVFTIWSFIVVSIGLAKMFKSASTVKYYVMVFGVWIGWSLIVYILAKAVPFLSFLGG